MASRFRSASLLKLFFSNIHHGVFKVCDSCPVNSPKDHLLLSVGSEVYKVCQDPDALLPFLIKNNPLLPVVHDQRVRISAATEGQTSIFRANTWQKTWEWEYFVILTLVSQHLNEQHRRVYLVVCVWVYVRMGGLDQHRSLSVSGYEDLYDLSTRDCQQGLEGMIPAL